MFKSILSKVLFVIGIIIILVVLAWAIINFVPVIFSGLANVGSSIGNIFKNKNEAIEVVVNDTELVDGEDFNVQWSLDSTENGTYSLSYTCVEGLLFEITIGDSTKRMICNTPLSLPSDIKEADIKTIYKKPNSFDDVELIVFFTPDGQTNYEYAGKTSLTVKNSSGTENSDSPSDSSGDLSASSLSSEPAESDNTTTTETSATYTSQPTYTYRTTYSTPADLAISNIVSIPGRSTVQFTVANIGGRSTGNWQLAYTNPTTPITTEYSPLQPSLAPGQSLRFTLAFTEQSAPSNTISISVDPGNVVSESSESNNFATAIVTGNYVPNNNNGSYNPNDNADLEIVSAEIGRVSGGRFIEDDRVNDGDDVVLHFRVLNRGGESTGSWRFEITHTPFDSNDDYRSSRQNSLRPGEYMDLYVDFDNVDEGDYRIRIEVDSDDDVNEERENNNTETVDLEVRN
ncbi:hypothetical protein H6775_02920 [Candidatus Nomurabacteria bacterium]|nr:hypothetical protein [Candidatus Nomurabacteria bacterium]